MKKFTTALIVLLAFGICISCGMMFSNIAMTLIFQTKIEKDEQIFYAISMKKSAKEDEIKKEVEIVQSQNAAGYIYKNGEDFYLLASVYENKNDATLVKEKLLSSGIETEIVEIKIKAKTVEGNFDAAQKLTLTNCLRANFNTYKKLYDISVALDTGVKTQTTAKLDCNNIYSEFITVKSNFETLFSNFDNMQSELDSIAVHLENLTHENYVNSSQTFSSLIKLTYCNILLS